jgi:hypothetical protein
MSFDDSAKAALVDIYATCMMGVEAVFSPLIGDNIPFNVILDIDSNYQPGGSVQVAEPQTTISYQRADLDRKVKRGEAFTIKGTVYTVRSMADYPDAWTAYEGMASVETN